MGGEGSSDMKVGKGLQTTGRCAFVYALRQGKLARGCLGAVVFDGHGTYRSRKPHKSFRGVTVEKRVTGVRSNAASSLRAYVLWKLGLKALAAGFTTMRLAAGSAFTVARSQLIVE